MRILAVDDDHDIGTLLPVILEQVGYSDITVATSGLAALKILAETDDPFDCFLLDINMPVMNGIELCRHIRSVAYYKTTPIIMLTAMHDKSFVDRAFQAGATDYATKPFELFDLTARLHAARHMVTLREALDADVVPTPDIALLPPAITQHPFALTDEVEVDGNSTLIRLVALQNYVTHMTKAGSEASQVFAVKIDEIGKIYTRATSAEFHYALAETADAIAKGLQAYGPMMAYAGNGLFLVVSGKFGVDPGAHLAGEIQEALDDKDIQYDSGAPLDITVYVGNPLRPSIGAAQRARTTFDRAIARAEHQASTKSDRSTAPYVRRLGLIT